MKHLILTFCIIFTVISSSEGRGRTDAIWKEIDGVSVPVPPAEHPRLYVRAYEIPELKEKMKTPDGRKILAALEEAAVDRTPEEEAKEKDRGFRYYFKMRGLTSRVQLQALDYLVDGDRTQARRAIVSMLDSLKRTSFGTRQDLSS